MVNKYKLIKKYPSLNLTWEVGMEVGQGDRRGTFANFSPCNGKYNEVQIPYEDVVNYPEFWEKVVEKDYEILQFICKEKRGVENVGTILTKQPNGSFWIFPYWTEEEMLKLSHFAIYSIKRLSDGEIFAIGDVCDGVSYERRPILEFKIVDNTLSIRQEFGHTKLSNLKKSKTPLFTTADGVDYYSDDDLVWDTHNYASNSPAIFSNPEFLCKTKVKWAKSLDRKFFSTKEAAEKYKEENKPQFSKKDLLYFIHEGRHYHPSIASSDVLKELIRLKK